MALDELWTRLAHASSFRLVVHPTQGPSHTGTGSISPQLLDQATIIWTEQGRWTEGPLAGIHFSNRTRWERQDHTALRVSHQRRGPNPVLLSTLHPGADGAWHGNVHPCGADRYRPKLSVSGMSLQIEWNVTSPVDPYRWTLKTT